MIVRFIVLLPQALNVQHWTWCSLAFRARESRNSQKRAQLYCFYIRNSRDITSAFDRFFTWLFSRTRRYNNRIEKYGALGLIPFVAIPLPITGAWTACAVAFVFGIRCRYTFPAVLAGVLIAWIIVTLSCMGVLVIMRV
ncbi:MAG: small multi-drug export protein [Euryarchaeota archaeon]|nr:small multi-drug export protein [Euryarchaeota archaeon]